jgi:hypothetical protein
MPPAGFRFKQFKKIRAVQYFRTSETIYHRILRNIPKDLNFRDAIEYIISTAMFITTRISETLNMYYKAELISY